MGEMSTLPALAAAVAEWFPELGGRAVAVSDATVTKDNIPTLPVFLVALVREDGNHAVATRSIKPAQKIAAEFWFSVERYRLDNGRESPFWAFYDFEPIRNRFVSHLLDWISPNGAKLRYDSAEIEVREFGVSVVFYLTHTFNFCRIEEPESDPCFPGAEPPKAAVAFKLTAKPAAYCPGDVVAKKKEEKQECP